MRWSVSPFSPPTFALSTLSTTVTRYNGNTGTYFTKSRNLSRRSVWAATREMVVLSPPGMMRASHVSNAADVRTSTNSKPAPPTDWRFSAAWRRRTRCSRKPPCRQSTPTVRGMSSVRQVLARGVDDYNILGHFQNVSREYVEISRTRSSMHKTNIGVRVAPSDSPQARRYLPAKGSRTEFL